MTPSSRLSQCDFPSDTFQLVDVCVERVRLAARLDDDAVLPPLPVVAPRRDVVMLAPIAAAFRVAGDGHAPPASSGSAGHSRRDVATARGRSRRAVATGSRGPLVACALVALVAASASFFASPLGRAPSVVRVAEAARGHGRALVEEARATVALVSRPRP